MAQKQWRMPHTFTIVLFVVLVAAVMTWLLPGGSFERENVEVPGGGTRELVVADSYHPVERQAQTWQVFSAFYDGFVKTAHIIVFVFMVGGAFWIVNATNAIDRGVGVFLRSVEAWKEKRIFRYLNVDYLIISVIMVMFSLFGAIFGMSEETLAFMIIFVPLAVSMGYDSLVGLGMCYLAAHLGFAGGMLNPFTIGIAQGLAELPAFSGLNYRFLCWGLFTLSGIIFVLVYAGRIRRNPQASPMYAADSYWRERMTEDKEAEAAEPARFPAWTVFFLLCVLGVFLSIKFPFSTLKLNQSAYTVPWIPACLVLFVILGIPALRKDVRYFILNLLLMTVLSLVIGVLSYGWYIKEIAALFFAMGIVAGLAYACSIDRIVRLFIEGCKDMLTAALVIGLAGGILVMLQDGCIVDTLLYGMASAMDGAGRVLSTAGMYVFQNALNIVIPSGSAKAALTIPIMTPFADLLGISRQTMVLAFQFGDGITNLITPASGVLIGCLGVARVPYAVWVKWIYKWLLLIFLIGFLLLLPTLFLSVSGF